MMDGVIDRLDTLIALTKQHTIADPEQWLDVLGVAALLSYEPRYVAESLAQRQDFPKAMRVDGKGHPRWKRGEVLAWAENQRTKS